MGKGGEALKKTRVDDSQSWLNFDTLYSAIQTITGNKWAEGAVSVRRAIPLSEAIPPKRRKTPISWNEIKLHASEESCWIVVKNKVYDVTHFAPHHPGGAAILTYGGRDASDVFAAFHARHTWSELEKFCIGTLEVIAPSWYYRQIVGEKRLCADIGSATHAQPLMLPRNTSTSPLNQQFIHPSS